MARNLFFTVCCIAAMALGTVGAAAQEPATSAPAAEHRIPFRGEAEPQASGWLALRVAVTLGVVLAVGVAGLYLLRKYFPSLAAGTGSVEGKEIQVVEARRLTPRMTVFLIESQGNRFLFVQSGDRVVPLTPLPRNT